MATTHDQYQEAWSHDHAGARWLAPFLAVLLVTMIGLALMLIYPYLGLSGRI